MNEEAYSSSPTSSLQDIVLFLLFCANISGKRYSTALFPGKYNRSRHRIQVQLPLEMS